MRFGAVLRHKRGGKVHIARSISKGAGWSYCGELFNGTDSVVDRAADIDRVDCRACREAELLERRHRRAGWWTKEDVAW